MCTRLLSLAFLFSVAPLVVGGDSWPGFRGPTADGHSDAKKVPTVWSEKDKIQWKVPIHGKGWSSPVARGDQIWVTTADEVAAPKPTSTPKGAPPANPVKEVSFYAVCLDRATGKILHDIKLGTEENPAYCHPFNSYASPTPFLEKDRLYGHFGSHGTWCVDTTTGKVLWERRDLKCDHFRGAASSPVVHDDRVYLIFDGFDQQYVCALDANTGKTLWKTDRNIKYSTDNGDYKKAYATASIFEIDGKPVLVCPAAECTIAYDPATGGELWRVGHGGMNGAARPILADGLLYLTSGYPAKLLAVNPSASPQANRMLPPTATKWETNKTVPTRPSLLLDSGLLYMVSDSGIASCLDAKTGKVYWSERLDGEFSASPMLAGGKLYFCNQIGKTFVVNPGKTFNVQSENRLEGGFMANPAVIGDQLLLRTRTHLYCIAD